MVPEILFKYTRLTPAQIHKNESRILIEPEQTVRIFNPRICLSTGIFFYRLITNFYIRKFGLASE